MQKLVWNFVFILLFPCGFIKSQTTFPTFEVSNDPPIKIKEDQKYTFGYLEVPENRSNPESKTIKLPVYIFKSRNPNPRPDPIIYTVGGPGYTSMTSAPYMNYYQYLDDRDFILFEQRGNYYANPHLDCPEWAKAVYQSNLPGIEDTQADNLLKEAAEKCRNRLIDKGIDLNGYHTKESAADINDLVQLLEIEQYNLLTLSYSTKIAQVLLRDYPERIRSVVMDSPLPLEVNYDEESVENLLASMDLLLSGCENDLKCNTAFPNLKQRFSEYLIEKTKDPLIVSVAHPETGEKETFYLKGKDLIMVFTSSSTGGVSSVPLEIEKLLTNDLSSIKEELASLFEGPGNGSGMGMRLSVWCAEEYPFNSQAVITQETEKYPQTKGLSPAVFDSGICNIWGVKPMEVSENQAVQSDIPVLLISGEYDNETPPKWASAMQKNLENSYHLVFKGWKHAPTTNWGNPCAMEMANRFFNNPSKLPESDCFDQIKAPIFNIK